MVLAKFDPVEITAAITVVTVAVQFIKKAVEWLESHAQEFSWARRIWTWWAHGKGPVILSAVTALVVTVLPDVIADGRLTLKELNTILQVLGVFGGSNILYVLARKFAFKKDNTWDTWG